MVKLLTTKSHGSEAPMSVCHSLCLIGLSLMGCIQENIENIEEKTVGFGVSNSQGIQRCFTKIVVSQKTSSEAVLENDQNNQKIHLKEFIF